MTVRDILKQKGPQVYTIGDEKKVADAIEVLVNNNIGSLLVLNTNGKIVGIITERDVLNLSHKLPDGFRSVNVNEVMTKDVIVAEPDDEMDYIEAVMTENHIRHLPIIENKVLVGMISIGDIVKNQIQKFRSENKYLMDYISGNVK